jgi:hypothetical protein
MTVPAQAVSLPDELEFQYELARDEFVTAYMRILRFRLWRQVVMSAIAVAGLGTWILLLEKDARLPVVVIMIVTAYSGASIFPRTRGNLRRHWKKHPYSGAQVSVTFNSDGVRSSSWNGYSMTHWHGFTHYEETAKAFLIFSGPQDARIYPKRALAPESIERLRQILHAHIGRTKYVKPVQAFPVESPAPIQSAEKI